MKAAFAVVALALAACAPNEEAAGPVVAPPPVNKINNDAVPPPTPAAISLRFGAADNGRMVSVPQGARFAVELVGVPTAGYIWQVDSKPEFLSVPQQASGNTSAAQSMPGFAGGNHWEVFVFTADRAGEGVLKLGQRRPWEEDQPPSQTFTLRIRVD